ncbi:hypothetical protein SLS63_011735 [Diaporthe eres]|uniref:Uncharacterized protein n=1 Tax=Diaporthe eres TaxID=83184 RepID=A0ABR1NTA7_DIAER
MQASNSPEDIAIVGGGIVGLILAAGLFRRSINVTVYERARGFREIGAGIAFTANAIRCMQLIDPSIVAALRSSGAIPTSTDPKDPNDYLRWVNGFVQDDSGDGACQRPLCKIDAGVRGFEGCRRDQFLEELAKLVPKDKIVFRKHLIDLVQPNDPEERLKLVFEDGTIAHADAVFGCDGVKSYVRKFVLGCDSPASSAHYSHQFAFRGLIPMTQAITALGDYEARNQFMHVGPGMHLIHYPVANHTMVNVAAFVHDAEDWVNDGQMVAPATREEVRFVFRNWVPPLRHLRWTKAEVCFEEIRDRTFKIWHFDYESMLRETRAAFEQGLDLLS